MPICIDGRQVTVNMCQALAVGMPARTGTMECLEWLECSTAPAIFFVLSADVSCRRYFEEFYRAMQSPQVLECTGYLLSWAFQILMLASSVNQ